MQFDCLIASRGAPCRLEEEMKQTSDTAQCWPLKAAKNRCTCLFNLFEFTHKAERSVERKHHFPGQLELFLAIWLFSHVFPMTEKNGHSLSSFYRTCGNPVKQSIYISWGRTMRYFLFLVFLPFAEWFAKLQRSWMSSTFITLSLHPSLYLGHGTQVERKWPPQEAAMSWSLVERLMMCGLSFPERWR